MRNVAHQIAFVFGEIDWGQAALGIGLVVGLMIVSVVVVAVLLVKLPATFFLDRHNRDLWIDRHPVLRWGAKIAKNLIGLGLLAVGIVFLIGPGQGVLTILIGIVLLDIPGKRKLERRIIGRPKVLEGVNRLRARYGQPPIVLDE